MEGIRYNFQLTSTKIAFYLSLSLERERSLIIQNFNSLFFSFLSLFFFFFFTARKIKFPIVVIATGTIFRSR